MSHHDAGGRPRSLRWLAPSVLVVLWLVLGSALGPLAGKLGDVAQSGSAAYLPEGAEATQALELNEKFGPGDALPGIVVFEREGGLTVGDDQAIRDDVARINQELGGDLAAPATGPLPSEDGEAAQVLVLFTGSDMFKIAPLVEELRDLVGDRSGLDAHVTGPAGVQADLDAALGSIDVVLILVTAGIVLVILVLVYRSPILPFVVLGVAVTALGVANGLIYLLAEADMLTMGTEAQGILSVLVLGCGTDYALLLVARFREELRQHSSPVLAMRVAWRQCVEPIVASAGTVALSLLCLVMSDLGLNKGLGPAAAIGVICAMVAMLTFLPAVLVLLGGAAFWPRRPHCRPVATQHALPSRSSRMLARSPRLVWVTICLGLGLLATGMLRLDADGISESEMIISDSVDSKLGQRVVAEHFAAGAGSPTIVITDADQVRPTARATRDVPGVAAVSITRTQGSIEVVDGLSRLEVTLGSSPDSDRARSTVIAIREVVHDVPGANAQVGGYTAVELDFDAAAERDRRLIPILLGVIFVLIAMLLRSIVAPLLLLPTVVLSFLAAIGVSTVVFQDLLGFPGVDSTFPLHAFVFLLALGADYNIFLMSRVREESLRHGTRAGTLIALTATGPVITSAGLVLAATFAALALVPLVLMVELAFAVAFGVLLDTFIVRSLLVPALVLDTGRRVWWPGRLARAVGAVSNQRRSAESMEVTVP